MRRLLPKSLAGQTILVLLLGLTFSHVLSMAIYSSDRAEVLMVTGDQLMAHPIAEITRLLRETPAEWRERIVHVTSGPLLQVSLSPESTLVSTTDDKWRSTLIQRFLARLVSIPPSDVVVQWLEVSEAGQRPVSATGSSGRFARASPSVR